MMWRVEVETKAEVEVGNSGGDKGGDETGGVGDATGEGGADKSAAYSSSPVRALILLLLKFQWISICYNNILRFVTSISASINKIEK